jgi:hypothetical protein
MEAIGGNEIIPKAGSDTLAEYRDYMGRWTNPYWTTWDVGEGLSLAQSSDWTPAGGSVLMRWPYYPDYAVNLMIFLSQNPIPTEVDLIHRLRGKYLDYRSTKRYLLSIMDFAEKLGANMAPVYNVITSADDKYDLSVTDYIDYDFEGARDLIESSVEDLQDASGLAFKLKDQVMFWIYLIEWSVLTATLIIAGSVVWTLMVRRRLYKEAESTRFT